VPKAVLELAAQELGLAFEVAFELAVGMVVSEFIRVIGRQLVGAKGTGVEA